MVVERSLQSSLIAVVNIHARLHSLGDSVGVGTVYGKPGKIFHKLLSLILSNKIN